ncbi:MAG: tetratricopeptide repeat protein [Congregibacter sp.]
MTQSFPRKYWWAVLVAVPIAVALISALPNLLSGDNSSASTTFDLQGAQFDGEVTMIDTQLIMEQIHQGADSDEIESLLQRAINLSKTGFQKEAIALFEDLAERTKSPEIFNNLGAMYTASGQTEKAYAAFREGLARRPDSGSLALNMARLYAQENKVGEALHILDATPRTDAGDALRNDLTAKLSSGQREVEPNNNANQPMPVTAGSGVMGDLSHDEDIDFYAFTVGPAPRDWTRIHVQTRTPSLKLHLQVLNSDKSLHWQSAGYSNQVTAGQDIASEFVLTPEQRYLVAVSSLETAGNYELRIEALERFDRLEPNDNLQTATNIAIDQTIDASILDAEDVDYYQISDIASVKILLKNSSPVLQPLIVVFDGDHKRLWQSAGYAYQVTANESLRGTVANENANGFYIAVSSLGGRGDYALTLSE